MKIQESSLQLQASHEAKRTHKVEVTMQREFRRVFSDLKAAEGENAEAAKKRVQKMLQSLIDAIIAAVDGKKCTKSANLPEAAETSGTASGSGELPRLPGVGGEIDWRSTRIEYLYESETSQVCGQGRVVCSDGRSLEFEFSFSRAREFEKTSLEHSEGTIKLRDPLILSFPGCASELSEERIDFDLDAHVLHPFEIFGNDIVAFIEEDRFHQFEGHFAGGDRQGFQLRIGEHFCLDVGGDGVISRLLRTTGDAGQGNQ